MKRLIKNNEKRIVAFVDYEHWYISLETLHGKTKPDISTWFADLNSRGHVVDAIFFGDFSKGSMKNEISRIRRFSNKIIDTCNPNPKSNKDFTDFIILDNIYQRAMSSDDIDVFVIFSGDAHFSSAVAFLKNNMDKEVGIYGVSGAFSRILKDTASWYTEVPEGIGKTFLNAQLILNTIRKLEKNPMQLITTTVVLDTASDIAKTESDDIRPSLIWLEEKEIIRTDNIIVSGQPAETLKTDWKKAETFQFKVTK